MAYESLKKLQAECRKYNLSESGTKGELTQRLKENQIAIEPVLFSTRITTKQKESAPILFETISSKNFSSANNFYYIQVNQSNLFTYLNNAVIFPLAFEDNKIYKEENRITDLFTRYPNHIILSTGILSETSSELVNLEITTGELKIVATENSSIFVSEEPIPISRISRILFSTPQSKNFFLSNIKTFPDVGINPEICIVLDKNISRAQTHQFKDLNLTKTPGVINVKLINRFDKILGMFAFMKNAALFFVNRDGILQEYSNGFFSALTLLNSGSKIPASKESSLLKFLLFPNQIEINSYQRLIFAKVVDYIYRDAIFDFDVASDILTTSLKFPLIKDEEKAEISYALEKFQQLKDHLISYTDLVKDDVFKKNLPLLSLMILTKFSNKNKQHTDKQSVRNLFVQHADLLGKSVTEFLLAILGLYYGYKLMVKQDTNLRILDKQFEKIADEIQNIKFALKNNLERFVIETCFQFSISADQINDNLNYLPATPSEKNNISFNRIGALDYQVKRTRILETDTLVIERINLLDQVVSMITESYPEGNLSNQYLSHYVLNKIGLDRLAIVDILRRNASKISVEELAAVVQFDRKKRS